jgi:hypothetical protein
MKQSIFSVQSSVSELYINIYSRLYIRGSDGKLHHLIIGLDFLMRFDDFASLATASHVSRTGGKLFTRNTRLDASKSRDDVKVKVIVFTFLLNKL